MCVDIYVCMYTYSAVLNTIKSSILINFRKFDLFKKINIEICILFVIIHC